MSLSDKVTMIVNKIRHVYDSGVFDAGFECGRQSAVDDALEGSITTNGIKEMWEASKTVLKNRTDYKYAFYAWPDELFQPPSDGDGNALIAPADDGAVSMFAGSFIKTIDEAKVNFSNVTSLNSTFRSAIVLESVYMDVSKVTEMRLTFNSAESLETVAIVGLSPSCTFTRAFGGCYALKNLSITGTIGQNGFDVTACTELSSKSVNNIIAALEDKSGDTSGEIWLCKIAPECYGPGQKQDALNKGWYLNEDDVP